MNDVTTTSRIRRRQRSSPVREQEDGCTNERLECGECGRGVKRLREVEWQDGTVLIGPKLLCDRCIREIEQHPDPLVGMLSFTGRAMHTHADTARTGHRRVLPIAEAV